MNALSVNTSETLEHLSSCKVNGKHSGLIRQALKWFIQDTQVILEVYNLLSSVKIFLENKLHFV